MSRSPSRPGRMSRSPRRPGQASRSPNLPCRGSSRLVWGSRTRPRRSTARPRTARRGRSQRGSNHQADPGCMTDLSLSPQQGIRHFWATIPAALPWRADHGDRRRVLPGPQPEPAGGGPEPGRLERLRQRRVAAGPLPVGAFHGQPPERAAADGRGQRVCAGRQPLGIVGPGQQGPAAALDVKHQRSVHEYDKRTRLAARPVRGDRLAGAVGPGQRRPVGLSRVRRGQHLC